MSKLFTQDELDELYKNYDDITLFELFSDLKDRDLDFQDIIYNIINKHSKRKFYEENWTTTINDVKSYKLRCVKYYTKDVYLNDIKNVEDIAYYVIKVKDANYLLVNILDNKYIIELGYNINIYKYDQNFPYYLNNPVLINDPTIIEEVTNWANNIPELIFESLNGERYVKYIKLNDIHDMSDIGKYRSYQSNNYYIPVNILNKKYLLEPDFNNINVYSPDDLYIVNDPAIIN